MSEEANETKPAITAPPAPPTAEAAPVAPEVITTPPAPENILTRIVRAIDRAMSAEPKRTGPALTFAMILDSAGGQDHYVSPSALAQFRAWQKLHDLNLDILLNTSPQTAKAAWMKHQEFLQSAIHAETVSEQTGHSYEDFEKSHEQKIAAAKENMQKIYRDMWPLCSTVAARCIEVAEAQVKKLEASERARHEWYGVPFSAPSAIVTTFRDAIAMARVRSQFMENGQASPRLILPYLNF
jgi:hypothetical protein